MNECFCHVDYLYLDEAYSNLPDEKKRKNLKENKSDSSDIDDFEENENYFDEPPIKPSFIKHSS